MRKSAHVHPRPCQTEQVARVLPREMGWLGRFDPATCMGAGQPKMRLCVKSASLARAALRERRHQGALSIKKQLWVPCKPYASANVFAHVHMSTPIR
jgi:hypothetical protein